MTILNFFESYTEKKEVSRCKIKANNPQQYVSDQDFRSSSDSDDIGYILYVLDYQNLRNIAAAQTKNVEMEIFEMFLMVSMTMR